MTERLSFTHLDSWDLTTGPHSSSMVALGQMRSSPALGAFPNSWSNRVPTRNLGCLGLHPQSQSLHRMVPSACLWCYPWGLTTQEHFLNRFHRCKFSEMLKKALQKWEGSRWVKQMDKTNPEYDNIFSLRLIRQLTSLKALRNAAKCSLT